MQEFKFPPMPLSGWQSTRDTIHKYSQVVGEVRAAMTPRSKHWWHISLRPDVTGLTTPPIPTGGSQPFNFRMLLDFMSHQLVVTSSQGKSAEVDLQGQSVAEFCEQTLAALSCLGVSVEIDRDNFEDTTPGEYDKSAVASYWQALGQIATIFEEFKSGLRQETSAVNLWPHHFDMAFVWFSGRIVPDTDPNDAEYADEQMSFGFTTGDEGISDPYFYISAYPMPDALKDTSLPADVSWYTESWQGALLQYDALVQAGNPKETLLAYLRTLHEAGERLMR